VIIYLLVGLRTETCTRRRKFFTRPFTVKFTELFAAEWIVASALN